MKKQRPFISLFIAFCIIIIAVTGVMLYLLRHSNTTAAVHTTIGFFFLVFISFHIINNWKAIIKYSSKRGKFPVSKTILVVVATVSVITFGVYSAFAPFQVIYDFGNRFRSQQETNQDLMEVRYEIVNTNTKIGGRKINVEVTKGPTDYYTVMAIWMEDTAGNYIETLYATKNIATGTFWQTINGEAVRVSVRRPEAVPYWSYKRGVVESDGKSVPTPETPLADAITGATPESHFILRTSISDTSLKQFKIIYEVNRSYDWNEYYNEHAFPDDPIYSGSGQIGQPSLIYSTNVIDLDNGQSSYLMNVIGHGHHSGADGKLYPDLSNITTAFDITERVLVIKQQD